VAFGVSEITRVRSTGVVDHRALESPFRQSLLILAIKREGDVFDHRTERP
jgi:hypothetical protein